MRFRKTMLDQGEEGSPALLMFYGCLMMAAKYLAVDGATLTKNWSAALFQVAIGDAYMYADVSLLRAG